jgi:hypothetical protein
MKIVVDTILQGGSSEAAVDGFSGSNSFFE